MQKAHIQWGFLGFPFGSAGKESACNVGDLGSIPGLGRSPGEGKSYPLQYSGLDNSMDCIVHGAHRVGHDWVTFTFIFNGSGELSFSHMQWLGRSDHEPRLWSQNAWVIILALTLVSTTILDKLLHLSVPPFPHLLHRFNELLFVKHLQQNLACSQQSISYPAALGKKWSGDAKLACGQTTT